MNKIYALPEDELRGEIYQRMLRLMGKNRGTWESVAAAAGLLGGLLAIVLGGLVWVVVGAFAPSGALGASLDVAGTILFVLPLPLMALGACCLDRLERKAPALPLPARSLPETSRPVVRTHLTGRRSRHALNSILIPFGLLLSFAVPAPARAQQTLFNVPTTDVLARGKVYAKLDVRFKPDEGKSTSDIRPLASALRRRLSKVESLRTRLTTACARRPSRCLS